MTKAQKIEALERFADQLPEDSYLKPWLHEVKAEVEADMRNDFPISVTRQATNAACAVLLEDAKREAARLIGDAETNANRLRQDGERSRGVLLEKLRQVERTLCTW